MIEIESARPRRAMNFNKLEVTRVSLAPLFGISLVSRAPHYAQHVPGGLY
jgi:hypothetical protein